MPLNLNRRLAKGEPLTAAEHDQNLDVVEAAIEEIELTPGPAGSEVELGTSETHVQWRYQGATTWTDLVPLSELAGPPGPSGVAGSVQTCSTSLLPAGGLQDLTLTAGAAFHLMAIESSSPAWVRVYGTPAARAADDRTQPGGTLPAAGSEFYAEVVIEAAGTIRMSPVPLVQATDDVTYLRVVNVDSVSRTIALGFNVLTLQD